jgi:hypothetical protein
VGCSKNDVPVGSIAFLIAPEPPPMEKDFWYELYGALTLSNTV